MVEVPGLSSKECGVNHMLVVHFEQIAVADSLLLVSLLPLVRHFMPDDFSDILDEDISFLKLLLGEQSNPMNLTLPDLKLLWVLHCFTVLGSQR